MLMNERMAGVAMLIVGAVVLAVGLALEDDHALGTVATIMVVGSVSVALARVLRRRPPVAQGSPWWGFLLLALLPLAFVADFGGVAVVLSGALLIAEGFEVAARTVIVPRH